MEQIFLAYGLPKDAVTAIMMLNRNTKAMVRSTDGDTDFFDVVAGVLQRDTLAPYMFIAVGDLSRGCPEGSLFDSFYTKVYGRALLLFLDCSTLPLIPSLYCCVKQGGIKLVGFFV